MPDKQRMMFVITSGDNLGQRIGKDAGRCRDRNASLGEKRLAAAAMHQRAGHLALPGPARKIRGRSCKRAIAQLRRPRGNLGTTRVTQEH